MSDNAGFVPALGLKNLTWTYDLMVALMTREGTWRGLLLSPVKPRPADIIVDIGCGTATLAIMIKRQRPQARVIGLDPDPDILRIARRKAMEAGVEIGLIEGGADRIAIAVPQGEPSKAVSSLVFHHLPLPAKRAALEAIFATLRPGGQLCLAGYGPQRTWLMRQLFRLVQLLDGFETTQPNADGLLPVLIAEVVFDAVLETHIIPMLTGSISLYEAHRS
jgi:ubiquinone/menaquinone biosynthesis C-methylase UbiE